ncbi:O-antigen ligase domain-containing protein [Nocardioides marmoriginsengisoli]|uniref:O-antigen ligase domain-containing protein n=1 Tax=Nocardioides marmoriginsengisoli TaxID=661483 RepID=A0A3N0CRJ4_9ACTN|nr:O-antigen ligase family protein [Nocardioides marmoriginsengisoli]RNL66087.1 O-antigen ligase domain-containing protein [Nocardioides marmoriginsengisoli]
MNALKSSAASLVGVVVLLLLLVVGVSTNQLLYSIAAVALAVALVVLVAVGPEKMGIGLMLIGMLMAPMNALGLGGNVTVSDIFFVLGFGLLIPRLLVGRPKLPPMYVAGASILFVGGMVTSLINPGTAGSLVGLTKVVAAMIGLVLVLNVLRPTGRLLDAMAWAYVGGQMISAAYSVVRGGAGMAQGRAVGLTTQPNFYGLGGQMAYALLIFLFYRVDPKHRWIVVGAMAVVGFSVVNSGSRASLLCCALITVAWPIVERSAAAWYVIVSGAFVAVLTADRLLSALGQDTVLDRLKGNTSAQFSDQARESLLQQGFDTFWKHPIEGIGWGKDTILAYHNAYLEVAVAGGVLTLVGFVLIVAALVRPLFRQGTPNRLAYAGLSYAAFGMIGPTLYDRIVWAVLALILITYQTAEEELAAEESPPEEPDEPAPRRAPVTGANRLPRPRPR